MGIRLNFPGNPRIRAQMERTLEADRLWGSFLFEGPAGAGQETAAVEVAAWAITASVDPAHPAAGRVLRYVHPDLLFVMPVEVSNAERMKDEDWMDAFREAQYQRSLDPLRPPEYRTNPRISVRGIRAVRRVLAMSNYEGRGKALIVRDADAMEPAAQDALLKTLEEPPANTLIVLISHRPEALHDTVLSRCRRLVFEPLPGGSVRELLVARGLDPERAEFFARLSGGDVESALRYAEAEDGEEGNALLLRRERWLDALETCEFADEVEMIEAVQELSGSLAKKDKTDKHPTQQRLDFMSLALSWYRDLLGREAFGGLRVNADQEARQQRFAGLDEEQLVDRIHRFEKARAQIHGYPNLQLLLLSLFLGLRASGARG